MKSSNNYIKLVLIAVLSLILVLALASCAGDTPAGGDGSSAVTTDGGAQNPGDPTGSTGGASGEAGDPAGTTGENGETAAPSGTTGPNGETDPAPSVTTGGSGGTQNPGSSGGSSGGSSSNPSGDVSYIVKVIDAAGEPIKNVIVTFYQGETEIGMQVTNSSGVAKKTLAKGDYTFELSMASGGEDYSYDASTCVLSATATSVTVTYAKQVTPPSSEGGESAPTIFANDKEYPVSVLGEGAVQATLTADDMTYFLFNPTREGLYSFSATGTGVTVDCGYYGGVHFVLANKTEGGVVGEYQQINVRTDNLGQSYVLGFKTTSGAAATVTITITRIDNAIPDAIASIPYTEVDASEQYLSKYTGSTAGTLTDVNISSSSTEIVKGSDGYYHLGSESGPVVMFRLDSGGTFLAGSISDMANKGSVSYFIYEGTTLVKKNRYNEMIASYLEVANTDGVVPLNDELIAMIKGVGEHQGWWDKDDPRYLFDQDKEGNPTNVIDEKAWMFLCCYYA